MYASIKFDKEAHFQSRGRNGYLNTHGVAVYNMGIGEFEEVHLHPITSRGEPVTPAGSSSARAPYPT